MGLSDIPFLVRSAVPSVLTGARPTLAATPAFARDTTGAASVASAGGTVSLLDAERLQDVTFLTSGYPAPHISRASSVRHVTQREGNRKEFGGWATLGFAGAGAMFEGPINAGKGSWMVSARRSFVDAFTDGVGFGGVRRIGYRVESPYGNDTPYSPAPGIGPFSLDTRFRSCHARDGRRGAEVKALLASLADRRSAVAGPESSDGRIEP